MKKKYIKTYKAKVPNLLYWGNSMETLTSWTGGINYKSLGHFEIFGIKIEFWRKCST